MKWMRVLMWLFAAALWEFSAVADIDPEARKYFEQGSVAYNEARYKDAIDLFLRAYAIDPKPALFYNAAQAYERMGDVPNALRSYRDYLRLDASAADKKIVKTRIRNLEARLRDKGVQQVSVFSTPSGAVVVVDGKVAGKTPWTGELSPGRHAVVLELEGHADATKEFLLGLERAMDLDVTMQPASASGSAEHHEPPAAPAAPSPPEADEPAGGQIQPWTWAAVGLGVASLGGALGFELARRGAESDTEDARTQLGHQAGFEKMESRQTTARILAGVGGVALAAGGVLLYLDLSSGDEGAHAGVGCATGYCGAHARGRF